VTRDEVVEGDHGLGGCVAPVGDLGLAQTGYQYERLAPEPSLKTPYNNDSMLMRAGYEQRHRECLDAGMHIDTVLTEKPNWEGAREMRLYCEREQDQRVEELNDTSKLIALQPGNWMRWRDRAVVGGQERDVAGRHPRCERGDQTSAVGCGVVLVASSVERVER